MSLLLNYRVPGVITSQSSLFAHGIVHYTIIYSLLKAWPSSSKRRVNAYTGGRKDDTDRNKGVELCCKHKVTLGLEFTCHVSFLAIQLGRE
jgi:hypothetical protein